MTVPDNRDRQKPSARELEYLSALSLSFFLTLPLSLSLYPILPSSIFHLPHLFRPPVIPPRPPPLSHPFPLRPAPRTPQSHGQLARLLSPRKLLHPKYRSHKCGSLSRRLPRVLSIHPQRDKTPQEDDAGPARGPRADLCS